MNTFQSFLACVGLTTILSVVSDACAQSRGLILLQANPRASHESISRWPRINDATNFFAYYHNSRQADRYAGSSIHFNMARRYLAGEKQTTANMQFEGLLRSPQAGETLALFNAIVRIERCLGSGDDAMAFLELTSDEYAQEASKKLGNGFFVSERAWIKEGPLDATTIEVERVQRSADSKQLTASIHFLRDPKREGLKKTLSVGDLIEMRFRTLRLTHIELGDEQAKRRGWVVLEPVLPEPVNIPK